MAFFGRHVGSDYVRSVKRWNERQKRWFRLHGRPVKPGIFCKKCGWQIPPTCGYQKDGRFCAVPGHDYEVSDTTCWWCPWTGDLDPQKVLDGIDEQVLACVTLWARQFGAKEAMAVAPFEIAMCNRMRSLRVLRRISPGRYQMPPIYLIALGVTK